MKKQFFNQIKLLIQIHCLLKLLYQTLRHYNQNSKRINLRYMRGYDQAQILIDKALRINQKNAKTYCESGNLLNQQIKNETQEIRINFKKPLFNTKNPQKQIQILQKLFQEKANFNLILGDCLKSVINSKQYQGQIEVKRLKFVLKKYQNRRRIIMQLQSEMHKHQLKIFQYVLISKLKQFSKAKKLFEQANIIEPNNQRRFYYQAMMLKEDVLNRLKNDDVEDPEYSFQHCYDDAILNFLQSQEQNPDNPDVFLECFIVLREVSKQASKASSYLKNWQLYQCTSKQYKRLYFNGHQKEVQNKNSILLTEKFTDALEYVDKGLAFDPENEELKNIKIQVEKIIQAKQIRQKLIKFTFFKMQNFQFLTKILK